MLSAWTPLIACTGVLQHPLPDRPDAYQCTARAEPLLVGAGEADITPAEPTYLAGFDMNRLSTGVHNALRARALVLVAGSMRVAIVGVDSLGLQLADANWIKSGIPGFANGCVFLCSSHTHAAPDPIGLWGSMYLKSGRDHGYLAQLRAGVVHAVARAEADLRSAVLVRGEARLPREGLVRNSNREGLFDPRLTVIQARDAESGEPLGALLHLACHPEVFGRRYNLVSSDFVGDLCDRWREAGHGQAVFVNGALGAMVTPAPRDGPGFPVMVDGLFESCRSALARAAPVAVDEIEVRRRDLYMGMTSPGLLLGRLTMVIPRPAYGGMVRTTLGYLRIGPIEAACIPGEMEPTLAARLRRATGKPGLLIFGLVDDEVGYLMREVDARDPLFDYERIMAPTVDSGELVYRELVGRSH